MATSRLTRRKARIIEDAARKAHIRPALLYGVWGAETNFGANKNRSSAGAQGDFQFMPQTAAGMGVNTSSFKSSAYGAARYLAQYKSRGEKGMLAAYNAGPAGNPNNPETAAYIPKVLSLAKGYPGGAAGGSGGGGGRGRTTTKTTWQDATVNDPEAQRRVALATFLQKRHPDSLLLKLGIVDPLESTTVTGQVPRDRQVPKKDVTRGVGKLGDLAGSPRDRAGVKTKPAVLKFARRISGITGFPTPVGTGTAHSMMTVNGNVSAHWGGDALDMPASGRKLILMGRAALVAAGMPRSRARKINGGLFNIGHWQIIFNTQEGGDHTDHLHAGRRR